MVRWIAFDDDTAEAVVSRFRRGAAEIHPGQPLDAALDLARPSVLLLPSTMPGRVLLARLEPKTLEPTLERKKTGESVGFLEQIGEPVFTKRPQPVRQNSNKKKWWQRRSA
jgi:hypothetical protein